MLTLVSYPNKNKLLLLITFFGVLITFCFPPIKQNTNYHAFADCINIHGISNFSNVISNFPFISFGLIGLYLIAPKKIKFKLYYYFLFISLIGTGIGSMYYHINPNNSTLFWDRLPMTIAFMSVLTILISQYIDEIVGKKLFWWLIGFGFSSVIYWKVSTHFGYEDLRPYIIVQFLPLILVPLILILYPGKEKKYSWAVILIYVAAKIFEIADEKIFSSLHFISGHTLKHLVASLIALPILYKTKKTTISKNTNRNHFSA